MDESKDAFRTSHWSVVLQAARGSDPEGRAAVNRLCGMYWGPLYAYLRRKGLGAEDAQDAVQGFFAHFLEKGILARVEPGHGQFRSYLLAVLEHYLSNEHRRAHARKRGGGSLPFSLDFAGAEHEGGFDPSDTATPADAYRRAWALTTLRRAVEAFRGEFESRHPPEALRAVLRHLASEGGSETYEEAARSLGCSTADFANLLQASRKRLRELVRDVIRETAETEGDVEDEMKELFASLH